MGGMRHRLLIVGLAALLLSACSNAPQEPSNGVDDRTAESPYAGNDTPTPATSRNSTSLPATPDTTTTASTSATVADVIGRWALDAAACEADEAVVTIAANEITRFGTACDIGNLIDAGNGSFTATVSCKPASDTGDNTAELMKLEPHEGSLKLSTIGSEEAPRTLSRCP